MCIPNLNVNCFLCKNIDRDIDCPQNVKNYLSVFNTIQCEKNVNTYYLKNFVANIFISAMETSKDYNPLVKKFKCKLLMFNRKTKNGVQLCDFIFNPKEYLINCTSENCKSFSNLKQAVEIESIEIPDGPGKYVLKFYICEDVPKDQKRDWRLQYTDFITISDYYNV